VEAHGLRSTLALTYFNDFERARTRLATSSAEIGGDIAVRGVIDGSLDRVVVDFSDGDDLGVC